MIVRLPDGRIAYTDGKAFAFILTGLNQRSWARLTLPRLSPDSPFTDSDPSAGTETPDPGLVN